MRRIIIVGTALAVLGAAVSAYAAAGGFNTYSASEKSTPNKAGSPTSPTPAGHVESFTASGTGGNRTAPLTNIKATIYGLVYDGKDFPTCSLAKIAAAKSDTVCPKGALVASGSITAVIGPQADPSASAPGTVPCDPLLHAWNAGPGKLVFFFIDQAPNHTCAGGAITTGTVGPYPATIKRVGKNLVINTPIPTYVSFPLAGVEGSLETETLTYLKLTKNVGGKKVAYVASVGCKKGKRPYSVAFTAQMNGQSQTTTVSGSQKCT